MNFIRRIDGWDLYFDSKLDCYELCKGIHHINFWCEDSNLEHDCEDIIRLYEGQDWPFLDE